MIQLLGLFLLVWVAVVATRRVRLERALFAEFNQSTAVEWLVWLYPLPLALPLLDHRLVGVLLSPIPFDVFFFLPAIAVATINRRCFERSGTDRVKGAERAAEYVISSGILAVIGAFVFALLLWVFSHSRL